MPFKCLLPLNINLRLAYFTCEFGLQVAAAGPVQSPADVMQRELDSCLSLEYTPESLPALLHQVGTSGRNTRHMHL